jgi:hypothetical protein
MILLPVLLKQLPENQRVFLPGDFAGPAIKLVLQPG